MLLSSDAILFVGAIFSMLAICAICAIRTSAFILRTTPTSPTSFSPQHAVHALPKSSYTTRVLSKGSCSIAWSHTASARSNADGWAVSVGLKVDFSSASPLPRRMTM
ncbi:hypothetical protein BDV98DRAFT_575941, partial [Pterulicium gracile]